MGLKQDLQDAQVALGRKRYMLGARTPLGEALFKVHEGIFEAIGILITEGIDITPNE